MLTIRAARGPDYYERAEFARDDYYEERGQVRGSWEGRGAQALGLSGGPEDGALGYNKICHVSGRLYGSSLNVRA